MLGPSGVFFMFAGFSMVATLFMWVYVRETRGLTDKEKKEVYKPKEKELKVALF